MKTDLETAIEFYEEALTDEQITQARNRVNPKSIDPKKDYVETLIKLYRTSLEKEYYKGVKRSRK